MLPPVHFIANTVKLRVEAGLERREVVAVNVLKVGVRVVFFTLVVFRFFILVPVLEHVQEVFFNILHLFIIWCVVVVVDAWSFIVVVDDSVDFHVVTLSLLLDIWCFQNC